MRNVIKCKQEWFRGDNLTIKQWATERIYLNEKNKLI